MVDTPSTVDIADDVDDAEAERKAKEAYFTAGQYALIWARFKKNRSAMVAGTILIIMIFGKSAFPPPMMTLLST